MTARDRFDCGVCGHGDSAHSHIGPHPCRWEKATGDGWEDCDCPGFEWPERVAAPESE